MPNWMVVGLVMLAVGGALVINIYSVHEHVVQQEDSTLESLETMLNTCTTKNLGDPVCPLTKRFVAGHIDLLLPENGKGEITAARLRFLLKEILYARDDVARPNP